MRQSDFKAMRLEMLYPGRQNQRKNTKKTTKKCCTKCLCKGGEGEEARQMRLQETAKRNAALRMLNQQQLDKGGWMRMLHDIRFHDYKCSPQTIGTMVHLTIIQKWTTQNKYLFKLVRWSIPVITVKQKSGEEKLLVYAVQMVKYIYQHCKILLNC